VRSFFPLSKGVFLAEVLILLAALVVLTKIAFTPANNLSLKNTKTASILTQTPKIIDLCAPFPTGKGEISCEEAKEIALSKYPGLPLAIDKTIIPYRSGKLPKIQTEERKIWLINIKPNDISLIPVPSSKSKEKGQTLEAIGVAVDRGTREILFFESFFKK
jgi:hypothetical protein